jgi:hypothetical protein
MRRQTIKYFLKKSNNVVVLKVIITTLKQKEKSNRYKNGVVIHAYNPSMQDAEAGG